MSRREIIARRKRQEQIKGYFTVMALVFGIIIVFAISGFTTNARSINDQPEYKYYMSYELEYGDTLWGIASVHCNDDYYDSIDDYIEEICTINFISTETNLLSGASIIIPYYSHEFK